jgi:polyisoprenoid-binding protein YceI
MRIKFFKIEFIKQPLLLFLLTSIFTGIFFTRVSKASELSIDITLTPVGSFTATTSKLKGEATKKGDLVMAKDVQIEISTLNSGIELRDEHMKNDYFEVKKFPLAVLKSAKGKNGKFIGVLNVHGVDQKISGTFEESANRIKAEFKTRLSDFKIKKAIYMGVGVKDEVLVKVDLPLK